jgi:hypothetical protein
VIGEIERHSLFNSLSCKKIIARCSRKMDLWIRIEDKYCNSIHKVSEVRAVFGERDFNIEIDSENKTYPIFGKVGDKEILLGEYTKDVCNSIIEEIHRRLYSDKNIVVFTMPNINYKGDKKDEE